MKKASKFEEFHRLHREMWTWLSEHPGAGKKDWPGWEDRERPDQNIIELGRQCECFACGYSGMKAGILGDRGLCLHCPMTWAGKHPSKSGNENCLDKGSQFNAWIKEENRVHKTALRIANMPWKDR